MSYSPRRSSSSNGKRGSVAIRLEKECRVVVRRDAAIYKDEGLGFIIRVPLQNFRREKDRAAVLARTTAQRNFQVAILRPGRCIWPSGLVLTGQGESVVTFSSPPTAGTSGCPETSGVVPKTP